jgi:hypothetical protein
MELCVVVPGLGACGGLRVAFEIANRLQVRGHEVTITAPQSTDVDWFDLVPKIREWKSAAKRTYSHILFTSPSTLNTGVNWKGNKTYFVQMMEHMFFPRDGQIWTSMYNSYELAKDMKCITIARWLKKSLKDNWGINAFMVPVCVNRDHFYPSGKPKQNAIVMEGDARNPAKDTEGITWRVGLELKKKYGVKLWSFSANSHPYTNKMDWHVNQPSLQGMRRMYSESLFLLKASHFEGRACAPLEAMCCGTPTVRGIVHGDEDLVHEKNCLRVGYDYNALLEQAIRMMEDVELRNKITANAVKYIKTHAVYDNMISDFEEELLR